MGKDIVIQKGTVVAVDFDNTLCETTDFPICGNPIQKTIEFIKWCKSKGAVIILWTCREGECLEMALGWCKQHDVPIDYANENVPERIEVWGNDCRKVGADYYIDDKIVSLDDVKEVII